MNEWTDLCIQCIHLKYSSSDPLSPGLLLWIFKIYFSTSIAQKSFPIFFSHLHPYSTVLQLLAYFITSPFHEGSDHVSPVHICGPFLNSTWCRTGITHIFVLFNTNLSSNITCIFNLLNFSLYYLVAKYYFYTSICLPSDSVVKTAWQVGDAGLLPGSGSSPEAGNGNPLQYSFLGNPMDWVAWQARVHGVVKSQTQLSN